MIVNDAAKGRRTSVVLAVVLGLLQLSVIPNVGILGGRANLALVFVACACLGGDARKAPAIGFAAGLFYDLAGSGPIGLMALLLTLVGYVFAASGRSRVADDFGGSLVMFAPLASVVGVVYALVLLVLGISPSFVDAVLLRAIPGAVLDCVALSIVAAVLSRTSANSGGLGGGAHGRGGYTLRRGL